MDAIEFNKVTTGLGSTIAHLSTLVDTGRSFKLNLLMDYDNNTSAIELKSILGISDDQILISPIPIKNKQDNKTLILLSESKGIFAGKLDLYFSENKILFSSH